MNYLQLVNKTIMLSGADLDELTSSTFSSTTNALQKRFKSFVASAWSDIQMERDEWEFKAKSSYATVYPRLLITDGDRSTAIPANAEVEGDTTGATFTILSTTLLEGVWASGTAEAWIDLDDVDVSEVLFGEVFDETDPDPLNVNVFSLKGFGTYDLMGEVPDAYQINKSSFTIQSTTKTDSNRLRYISWADYQKYVNGSNGTFGTPCFIAEAPDGTFAVYPHPNTAYRVAFEYTIAPQELELYDDEPSGLAPQYHDAIVYRAMMNYADFDNQPHVYARGERRYGLLKNRMERNLMPTPTWGVNKYDAISF